uniref:Uncharacterized protein n=1 Tax=Opuntia streptacantha TaxID=393608 RepID=A0A7C9DBV3_OPUST
MEEVTHRITHLMVVMGVMETIVAAMEAMAVQGTRVQFLILEVIVIMAALLTGIQLLGGLLFIVIIVRCQAIPFKDAIKFMVFLPAIGCTKIRELQLLSSKIKKMFPGWRMCKGRVLLQKHSKLLQSPFLLLMQNNISSS